PAAGLHQGRHALAVGSGVVLPAECPASAVRAAAVAHAAAAVAGPPENRLPAYRRSIRHRVQRHRAGGAGASQSLDDAAGPGRQADLDNRHRRGRVRGRRPGAPLSDAVAGDALCLAGPVPRAGVPKHHPRAARAGHRRAGGGGGVRRGGPHDPGDSGGGRRGLRLPAAARGGGLMDGGLEFWGAVIAMAAITYLTRALPFALSARSRLLRRLAEGSSLAALGPALLAGTAVAVIVPDVMALQGMLQWLPYAGGLLATALAARRMANAGVAVIVGVAVYGALLALCGAGG